MSESSAPVFQPLGDSGLLVSWGNIISRDLNEKVIALSKDMLDRPFDGLIDCVQAYSSLALLYDLSKVHNIKGKYSSAYEFVKHQVVVRLRSLKYASPSASMLIEIPVCYDETLNNDLATISNVMKISKDEIIAFHTGRTYHVYMPGFIPGFVYMGEVDRQIAIPRKQKPTKVQPGAVAIAGIQTGIYPSSSPGGWHIVGYTPYSLFDATNEDPCLLHAGDEVQFVSICLDDYHKMKNQQHEHQHS